MTEWLTVILLFVIALGVWKIHLDDFNAMFMVTLLRDMKEHHDNTLSSIERLVGELKRPNNIFYMERILQVLYDIEKSVNRLR